MTFLFPAPRNSTNIWRICPSITIFQRLGLDKACGLGILLLCEGVR